MTKLSGVADSIKDLLDADIESACSWWDSRPSAPLSYGAIQRVVDEITRELSAEYPLGITHREYEAMTGRAIVSGLFEEIESISELNELESETIESWEYDDGEYIKSPNEFHFWGQPLPDFIPCECGAEKVNSAMHSTWCPKH